MSQGNAHLVGAAYDAFNRGDLAEASRYLHPDAEWHPYLGAVERDVYRGRESIVSMWRSMHEAFGGTFRIRPVEVIERGDILVVDIEATATGSESGAEVHHRWFQVATVRDGVFVRVEAYPDREAALAAADAPRPA